jgi:hypothetical protein
MRKSYRNPVKRCAQCLYRMGIGSERISKIIGTNTSVIFKWVKDLPEYDPVGRRARHIKRQKAEAVGRKRLRLERWELQKQQWASKPKPTPEEVRAKARAYYHRNSRRINDRTRHGRRENIQLRIKQSLRLRMWKFIARQIKGRRTTELLGCDLPTLQAWLRAQFKRGMRWGNYGKWEIDHRQPCSSFDLTKPEQQRACFHYSNLQPLWKSENRKKHAKIVPHQLGLLITGIISPKASLLPPPDSRFPLQTGVSTPW